MNEPVRSSAKLAVVLSLAAIVGFAVPAAAKSDPCKASCNVEKRECRRAYRTAYQTNKADCTGSRKAKRQCVKAARRVLRAAVRTCREFRSGCLGCCKADGTSCDVQCGDGIVSSGEACDPPGRDSCPGGATCDASCQCPSATTTTSNPGTVTTTTQPSPCANGVQDGTETAVDCGGGTCSGCADGKTCVVGTDCLSTFCLDGTCADPCLTQPAGTSCADDGNACTVDACAGGTCQHTPVTEGTTCRPAAGPCDVAEQCDGSGAPCPGDALVSGEVCRPRQGDCDREEECDGSSPQCPPDLLSLAGATCRIPGGVCDVAETCDGVSPECPADGFLGPETVCRQIAGTCDAAETCSGSSAACPVDGFQPSGTVCREAMDKCDVPETCVGNLDCPPDGPPKDCSDAQACTVDFCNPATGCVHQASSSRCDDANVCTVDFCTSGGFPGADPQTGCYHVAGNPGMPCGAGISQCDFSGNCVVPGCEDCSDGYSCTDDSCDVNSGCVHQGFNARCDDLNVCTTDLCLGGAPGGDPQTGCVHTPTNVGVACGPENALCDASGNCVVPDCLIDGVSYQQGQRNAATDCQVCDASRATDAWSPALAGTVCRPSTGVCDPTEVCNGIGFECPLDVTIETPKYATLPRFLSPDMCLYDSHFGHEAGYCDGTHGACQPLYGEFCDKDCYDAARWDRDFINGGLYCRGWHTLPDGTKCGKTLFNACSTKTCKHFFDEFGDRQSVCSPILNTVLEPQGTICEQEEFGTPGQVPYTPECKDECKCSKPPGEQCVPTSKTAVLGSACSQDVDCAFEHRCVDGKCASATTRAIGEACVGGDVEHPCSSGAFCCANKRHVGTFANGTCGNGCCSNGECALGITCCPAGGCVDLQNDFHNCGVCGRDCGTVIEQSACYGDETVACVDGRCTVSNAVGTCDAGLLCATLLEPSSVFPGRVIRKEGTTEDYTVEQVVLETVFARNSGGSVVQLQLGDILGNYAYCYPPGPPFESQKLNDSLCAECGIAAPCPDDLLCQGKCDGSWFNLLFCSWTSGVCVPDGTASACE